MEGSTCPGCNIRSRPKSLEHRQKISAANTGIPKGSPSNKMTLSEMKRRIRELSGTRYDLTLLDADSGVYVTLGCKEHGPFKKRRADVLSKNTGCPKCAGGVKFTSRDFFSRAKALQPKWLSFRDSVFVDLKTPVSFACKFHGIVSSTPYTLINKGRPRIACRKCQANQKLKEAIAAGRRLSPERTCELEGYRLEVRRVSNVSYKKYLAHLGRRTRKVHLDHKYSIYQGFLDGVKPEIIGHVTNLHLVKGRLNQSKGAECIKTKAQLIQDYRRFENEEKRS